MKKWFCVFCILTSGFMSKAQTAEVASGLYVWEELAFKSGQMRAGKRFMEGSSPHFEYLEIHTTTQQAGAKPAPPHTQENIEEVIILKEGLMKMTMDGESRTLGAGSVVLIPPLVEQSMENVGNGPLAYYVLMFRSKKPMDVDRGVKAGGAMFLSRDQLVLEKTVKGGRVAYFDRPTAMCEKFEMHVTRLDHKGPSHDPHSHVDTEIILITEGETTLVLDGEEIDSKAGDFYFIKSGQTHGIKNKLDEPCEYFAFRWF